MAVADDLERIAELLRERGEIAAVLAAEPAGDERLYLCAFADGAAAGRRWLVVDDAGAPVTRRAQIRDAVTIAALCELAAEHAFGGDLDELRAQLVALRMTERPAGVEAAEDAALALQRTLGAPPHVASPERLDEIGQAARELELALDPTTSSPFAAAMQVAPNVAAELAREVESSYLVDLQ